ncbi:MAG: glutamate 5-kinase [Candidatus Omnitrophota bacterium]
MPRKFQKSIKRIVIKVGSSLLATYKMRPRAARLRSLAEQISAVMGQKIDVVLVSSGAIVLGMGEMCEKQRPGDLASLQACAAVGQTVLMKTYVNFFKGKRKKCAQLLLTWDDFDNRTRYNNARNTLEAILARGIVPIINENDTISTEEIKFGDNDKLAALVAGLVHADLLIILSDVEGLYQMKDGKRKLFKEIKEVTEEIEGAAFGTSHKNISKGGMITKLAAVKIATRASIPCIIANGETKNVLLRILEGERIGTFFMEQEEKMLARKHWISFGAKPKGIIKIDDGAKGALLLKGKSLLLPGVMSWEGHFRSGDVVIVQDKESQEMARGVVNYSTTDLYKTADKKGQREVIHCDDLVLSKR